MAPKTTDYSKSIIYKIEHMDKPELVYVGSTTDFVRRKSQHKNNCNTENDRAYNYKLYQLIRANGNWESFKCMIICEFPCNTKTELIIEEEKHRKKLQTTLNSICAYCTEDETKTKLKECRKQYEINNKEKIKERRNENKDKLNENKREYYKLNKDKFKNYQEANKDIIKEKRIGYREKNKDTLFQHITCECGSLYTKYHKERHEKSKKHCDFIRTL